MAQRQFVSDLIESAHHMLSLLTVWIYHNRLIEYVLGCFQRILK
jgi:hypothetical protein